MGQNTGTSNAEKKVIMNAIQIAFVMEYLNHKNQMRLNKDITQVIETVICMAIAIMTRDSEPRMASNA